MPVVPFAPHPSTARTECERIASHGGGGAMTSILFFKSEKSPIVGTAKIATVPKGIRTCSFTGNWFCYVSGTRVAIPAIQRADLPPRCSASGAKMRWTGCGQSCGVGIHPSDTHRHFMTLRSNVPDDAKVVELRGAFYQRRMPRTLSIRLDGGL